LSSSDELLSDLLLKYLERIDRDQAWLAKQTKVNRATVSRWINEGSKPKSPELVARVAKVLKLSPHESHTLFNAAGYNIRSLSALDDAGDVWEGQNSSANAESEEFDEYVVRVPKKAKQNFLSNARKNNISVYEHVLRPVLIGLIFAIILAFLSPLIVETARRILDALPDLPPAPAPLPETPEEFYNRGVNYLEDGQYDLAIADFSKAIELNWTYIDAFARRSEAYEALSEPEEASDDLMTILYISVNSDIVDEYIYFKSSELGENAEDGLGFEVVSSLANSSTFDSVLGLKPLMDGILNTSDQYTSWIEQLNKIVAEYPKRKDAYLYLAYIFAERKNFEQAITNITQVLALETKGSENWFYALSKRADYYYATGELFLAMKDIETLIEQDDRGILGEYYLDQSMIHIRLGDAALAQKYFDESIHYGMHPSYAHYNRAKVLKAQGLYYPSIFDYTAALNSDNSTLVDNDYRANKDKSFETPLTPDSYRALLFQQRGTAYAFAGSPDLALADLRRAVVLDPDNAEYFFNLCYVGATMGRSEMVLDSCDTAIEMFEDGNKYIARGIVRSNVGNLDGAILDFQNAIDWASSRGINTLQFENYLSELLSGRNPFNAATLKVLIDQSEAVMQDNAKQTISYLPTVVSDSLQE